MSVRDALSVLSVSREDKERYIVSTERETGRESKKLIGGGWSILEKHSYQRAFGYL